MSEVTSGHLSLLFFILLYSLNDNYIKSFTYSCIALKQATSIDSFHSSVSYFLRIGSNLTLPLSPYSYILQVHQSYNQLNP